MIIGKPKDSITLKCGSCGFSNLVPAPTINKPPSKPGIYSGKPIASPTCAKCQKVLSYSGMSDLDRELFRS